MSVSRRMESYVTKSADGKPALKFPNGLDQQKNIKSIIQFLNNHPEITQLVFQYTELSNNDLTHLATDLLYINDIKFGKYCRMHSAGIELFAIQNTKCTHVTFDTVGILNPKDEIAYSTRLCRDFDNRGIASFVSGNKNITHLSLINCQVNDDGMAYFRKNNSIVTHLDMYECKAVTEQEKTQLKENKMLKQVILEQPESKKTPVEEHSAGALSMFHHSTAQTTVSQGWGEYLGSYLPGFARLKGLSS